MTTNPVTLDEAVHLAIFGEVIPRGSHVPEYSSDAAAAAILWDRLEEIGKSPVVFKIWGGYLCILAGEEQVEFDEDRGLTVRGEASYGETRYEAVAEAAASLKGETDA